MDPEVYHVVWWGSNEGHDVGKIILTYHKKLSWLKQCSWGESAGAISASLHMLTNGGNTEGLFRGAFMESGAPIPVGDIENGQIYYDALVSQTGCSGKADTLDCLRGVPYATLKAAISKSPGIFDYQVGFNNVSDVFFYWLGSGSPLSLHGSLGLMVFSWLTTLKTLCSKEKSPKSHMLLVRKYVLVNCFFVDSSWYSR